MCLINFNQMNLAWQQRGIGKNHDLARAIGLNKYKQLNILDATAGLARDAFILVKLGGNVTMLERHPDLIPLLHEALMTLEDIKIKNNLHFIPKDAIDYLETTKDCFDIIYLDPMFADEHKRAKVKKDMQYLQDIVGHDSDADRLLQLALIQAKKRVVVKRHKLSPFLANQQPHHQILGKSIRYDVYLCA